MASREAKGPPNKLSEPGWGSAGAVLAAALTPDGSHARRVSKSGIADRVDDRGGGNGGGGARSSGLGQKGGKAGSTDGKPGAFIEEEADEGDVASRAKPIEPGSRPGGTRTPSTKFAARCGAWLAVMDASAFAGTRYARSTWRAEIVGFEVNLWSARSDSMYNLKLDGAVAFSGDSQATQSYSWRFESDDKIKFVARHLARVPIAAWQQVPDTWASPIRGDHTPVPGRPVGPAATPSSVSAMDGANSSTTPAGPPAGGAFGVHSSPSSPQRLSTPTLRLPPQRATWAQTGKMMISMSVKVRGMYPDMDAERGRQARFLTVLSEPRRSLITSGANVVTLAMYSRNAISSATEIRRGMRREGKEQDVSPTLLVEPPPRIPLFRSLDSFLIAGGAKTSSLDPVSGSHGFGISKPTSPRSAGSHPEGFREDMYDNVIHALDPVAESRAAALGVHLLPLFVTYSGATRAPIPTSSSTVQGTEPTPYARNESTNTDFNGQRIFVSRETVGLDPKGQTDLRGRDRDGAAEDALSSSSGDGDSLASDEAEPLEAERGARAHMSDGVSDSDDSRPPSSADDEFPSAQRRPDASHDSSRLRQTTVTAHEGSRRDSDGFLSDDAGFQSPVLDDSHATFEGRDSYSGVCTTAGDAVRPALPCRRRPTRTSSTTLHPQYQGPRQMSLVARTRTRDMLTAK